MSSIFLSYRRADSEPWAILLYNDLALKFGKKNLFFDIEHITVGEWKSQIKDNLNSSSVMLVLIGKQWLTLRLQNNDDVHRYEIKTAIDNDVTLIPVVIPGGEIPKLSDIPKEISRLFDYEAIELSTKEDERKLQLKELYKHISKITKIPQKKQYTGVAKLFSYVALAFSIIYIASMLPSWIHDYKISSYRDRWEDNYQESYEQLDTDIFESNANLFMKTIENNPESDPEKIIFDIINQKISTNKNAIIQIPKYAEFFMEWLEFCNNSSCKGSSVDNFFNDKIIEFWSNYKCWIGGLRWKGYSGDYSKVIETYYETDEGVLERRKKANDEREVKISNGLELCPSSN